LGVTEQQPAIGRIVHYRLSEQDVADIFTAHGTSTGSFSAGDVLPAMVLRADDFDDRNRVDLGVQLGNATMLRSQVYEILPDIGDGTEPGWFWPPRV
jgi:hypothetical protein